MSRVSVYKYRCHFHSLTVFLTDSECSVNLLHQCVTDSKYHDGRLKKKRLTVEVNTTADGFPPDQGEQDATTIETIVNHSGPQGNRRQRWFWETHQTFKNNYVISGGSLLCDCDQYRMQKLVRLDWSRSAMLLEARNWTRCSSLLY